MIRKQLATSTAIRSVAEKIHQTTVEGVSWHVWWSHRRQYETMRVPVNSYTYEVQWHG